ncbi:MAG: zinc-ribbon domain-containing protein [Beijerinckiaceae bacterium]
MDIACPTCATTYEIDDASVGAGGRKVRCAGCGTVWRAYRDRPSEVISAPPPAIIEAPPPLAPTADDILPTPELPSPATYEQFVGPAITAEPQENAAAGAQPADASSDPGMTIATSEPTAGEKPARRGAKITKPKASRGPGLGSRLKGLISAPVIFVALTLAAGAAAFTQRDAIVRLVPQSAAIFATAGKPVNLRGIEIRNVRSRMVEDNGVSVLVIDGDLASTSSERVAIPRLRFAVLGSQGQELYVWSAQADRPTLQPGDSLNFRRRLAAPPSDGREVSVRFLSASDITAGLQ